MHERIRDVLLDRWGHAVAARPGITMCLCLIIAGASIWLTLTRLEFHPDRSDLVDRELPWNRRYADYKKNYARWDDLIICFEAEPDDQPLVVLTREIAARLGASPRVAAADAGFHESQADPRLFVLAPAGEFESNLQRFRVGRRIAGAENANEALAGVLTALASETGAGSRDAIGELRRLLDPYLATLRGEAPRFAFIDADQPMWRPLTIDSGRLHFILVEFADKGAGLDGVSRNLRWLREQVGDILKSAGEDGRSWGVTGITAIEADETIQSINDSTISSIIAFVAITVLMVIVFRGITVPLLAAGCLLIGMSWSFGWLVLSVGHLQLLSVVFSVILLGLGIDYALHLVARLELVQDEHEDLPSAIARVYRGIGPGMLTGTVTTAAAFAATALTEFKGMAEMGIIAGGGIVLCLVAMLSAFPAALALTGRWKTVIRHRHGGEEAHFAHGRLDVVDRRPWWTLAVVALVVAASLWLALQARYDPNVLNLHPPGIESVVWEKRLVEHDARSVWSALIETTPEKAERLTHRLRELPTVSDVGGMGILYPADLDARRHQVELLRAEAIPEVAVAGDLPTLTTQLASVRQGLLQRASSEASDVAAHLRAIVSEIDAAVRAGRALDARQAEEQQQRLEAAFQSARADVAVHVERALSPEPLSPNDLPEVLRSQWVGMDGQWLLRVYPSIDDLGRSVLDPERLGAFVESIRRIDPAVLGPPVQIYESSILIVNSYIKAAVLALAAIFVLLLVDFRSLADSLCAMVPVGIGFLGMFAIIALIGLPLNFANIIVLPMIFGIGVDAGVHMVHRWRVEPLGRPAGLSGATGRGITLTMATTIIGFSSMLLAEHRGIRSLGFVMSVGLGVTLLACYVALPPILRLRTGGDTDADRLP